MGYSVNKTKEMIEVMQAYVDGSVIEYKISDIWREASFPCWDWQRMEFRPKIERFAGDLPVGTVCRVWSGANVLRYIRSSQANGMFNENRSHPTSWENFCVLEQDEPALWLGGECPVPDYVKIKYLLRSGEWVENDKTPNNNLRWNHVDGLHSNSDIIAYHIMGEHDAY